MITTHVLYVTFYVYKQVRRLAFNTVFFGVCWVLILYINYRKGPCVYE